MITVTLNPAVDVSTAVDVVNPEDKLRCDTAVREPGGGGINVARVVRRLGVPVSAVTVVGGATGQQLVELLADEGLEVFAVEADGETRQSFSVSERSTTHQYRFVLPGPALPPAVFAEVRQVLVEHARPSNAARPIVIVSGSAPPGLLAGALTELIDEVSPSADVVVDTSGAALVEAVESTARLVKPSARELSALVGRTLLTEADVLAAAQEIVAAAPVEAVLASIGGGGAILTQHDEDPVRLRAPTVQVRSAIGAGDSLVGGLTTGLARGLDLVDASALGVAAGTAAVITEGSGLCHPATVELLHPLVGVT